MMPFGGADKKKKEEEKKEEDLEINDNEDQNKGDNLIKQKSKNLKVAIN